MPQDKQHNRENRSETTEEIEIQYILDIKSKETAKKLEKKTFEKLINKDLELIKKHKIKNSKNSNDIE